MWASKTAWPHVHTVRTKHPCNAIGNIFFPSEMQLILQNKAEVTPSVCRISDKPLKLNNTTPESRWWDRPGCFRPKIALIGHRPVSIAPHALFTSTGNAEEAAHWFMQVTGLLHVRLTLLPYLINVAKCFGHRSRWGYVAGEAPQTL